MPVKTMQNGAMKKIVLIIFLCLVSITGIKAQQTPSKSDSAGIIKELELSPQQRQAMRDTIIAFRQTEMKNRAALRLKLLALLDLRQQRKLRRWYQIKHH